MLGVNCPSDDCFTPLMRSKQGKVRKLILFITLFALSVLAWYVLNGGAGVDVLRELLPVRHDGGRSA